MSAPHMVKQTITYSDGSETVVNYQGVIVNGELVPNEQVAAEPETTVEAPAPEVVVETEVAE